MGRRERTILEYRDYELPQHLPLIVLTGDKWRISDIPSRVLHFHNCLEIGICHSERGTLRFQDTDWEFSAGDITLLSSDMPHTTFSAQGTASLWSWIFTDLEELLRPLIPFEVLPNSNAYKNLLHNTRLHLSAGEDPELSGLLHDVIQEMLDKRPDYDIAVRGLMLACLPKFVRSGQRLAESESSDSLPIAPALRYIDENYMTHFPMELLAELCRLSPAHFRRLFSSIMKVNPLEHLNRIRVAKACTLLRTTEDSVLTICEAVGFRSLSSFNRHFFAVMGESPTSWRKHMNAAQPLTIRKYAGWLAPPTVINP